MALLQKHPFNRTICFLYEENLKNIFHCKEQVPWLLKDLDGTTDAKISYFIFKDVLEMFVEIIKIF